MPILNQNSNDLSKPLIDISNMLTKLKNLYIDVYLIRAFCPL